MTLRIAFVGNCQAKQIEGLLSIAMPDYEIITLPSVHLLDADMEAEFNGSIASADIVLSHYISDEFPISFCRTSWLKEKLRSRLFLISNIYFTGYNSDISHLSHPSYGRLLSPLDGIHLQSVATAYLNGLTERQALAEYHAVDVAVAKTQAQASIDELKRRDRDLQIDIPYAEYFELLLPSTLLLHTFHHPTVSLIDLYLRHIAKALGLTPPKHLDLHSIHDHEIRNNGVHICVHPSNAQAMHARFELDELFKGFECKFLAVDGTASMSKSKYYDLPDLVNAFYQLYAAFDASANKLSIADFKIKNY